MRVAVHSLMLPFHLPATLSAPFLWLSRIVAVAGSVPMLALAVIMASDTTFIDLLSQHQVTATAATLFIFSAAASAMRNPSDGFYNWLFRFVNILAANSRDLIHVRDEGKSAIAEPAQLSK